jgi:hypothetical protein
MGEQKVFRRYFLVSISHQCLHLLQIKKFIVAKPDQQVYTAEACFSIVDKANQQ